MLVFSRTFDEMNPDELHPFIRLIERASGISIKQFVSIVADINEYLPDDWRMTTGNHEFRILVSYQDILFSLVGWSFRHDGGIIHIIDSVLLPSMSVSNAPKEIDKHPNLYYLVPRPDYSQSPLFARQFEKIKITENVESRIQYHRIHPLMKGGLDPDHFHWVKWNARSGEIQSAAYPEKDYHGKNYWALEELAHAGGRNKNIEPYLKQYNEIIEKHLDAMPKSPESPPSYAQEPKLLHANMRYEQLEQLIISCRNGLVAMGFSILIETSPFQNHDTYFDDENYSLAKSGMSFRLREKSDYVQVTLKAKQSEIKQNDDKDCYRRLKEEAPISQLQKDMLIKGNRISALPCRLIGYLSPNCGTLLPIVKIRTSRVSIIMANRANQKAELRVDHVYFYDVSDKRIGADVEIEIESNGMMSEEVATIAELLKEIDTGLSESSASKYERAIQYAQNTKEA
jgi:hypothetical protein